MNGLLGEQVGRFIGTETGVRDSVQLSMSADLARSDLHDSRSAAMIVPIIPLTGETVAFEELYERQYAPMVRLAFTLVDTQQRAEEVVQDAFAAIYERYHRLENPEAYLRTVVLNGCRRVLRRRMLHRAQPIPPGEDGSLGFNHVVDAIRQLPHKQRSMVVLRYDLQLTDSEIAETLGLPLGTVKSTLWRALSALRQEITR